jgi:hypothetical protein
MEGTGCERRPWRAAAAAARPLRFERMEVLVSGHGGFLTGMVATEKLWRGREKA